MTEPKWMIDVDVTAFTKFAKKHISKNWPSVVVNSFAEIAETGRDDGRKKTEQSFELKSDYVTRGIRHYPSSQAQKTRAMNALKRFGDFNAAVFVRGAFSAAKSLAFMADHEYGEQRKPQKQFIAMPLKDLRSRSGFKTARGRVRKRWKPETLLNHFNQKGSHFSGVTTTQKGKKLGPPTGRVPASPFLIASKRTGETMIVRRKERGATRPGQLEFLYVFKKQADIESKWKFVDEIYSSVRDNYSRIVLKHIKRMT